MHSVAKVLASVFGVAVLAALARGQCFSFQPACPGLNGAVKTMCSWDPDGAGPLAARLVAGGSFTENGQGSHDYIASWNGSAWDGLGWGTSGTVNAVTTWDPDGDGPLPARLVIGGDFLYVGADSTGQLTANHIAMWDGEAWRPLGTGADGNVQALTTWDPDGAGPLPPVLVAAGEFQNIGGTRVDFVATWDGTAWQNLGYGLSGPAKALATWDPDGPGPLGEQLVVGGTFLQAGAAGTGAITVNNIARWDGEEWHALPNAAPPAVSRIVPFGTDEPQQLALLSNNSVILYNGQSLVWTWFYSDVLVFFDIAAWDPDGDGPTPPQLVATGSDVTLGFCWDPTCECEYSCHHYTNLFGRWDGTHWHQYDMEGQVASLATWDPDGPGPAAPSLVGWNNWYSHIYGMSTGGLPGIINEPHDLTTYRHSGVDFSVSATTSLGYTYWYRNGVELANGPTSGGSIISGATTSTLHIDNVGPADGGVYTARARASCDWLYTDPARLTVCGSSDFNHDNSVGTDQDILDFFSCLAGSCCPACDGADFNGDGDVGDDADIEAFFRVLGGGSC